MSDIHAHEDALRVHDTAFYAWFEDLLIDYGDLAGKSKNQTPILRVFASPSRPFARIADTLVSRGFVDAATADKLLESANASNDISVLPLPMLTLMRGDTRPDTELSGVPKRYRKLPSRNAGYASSQWPGMYLTDYTATVWCAKRYTEAYIKEWLFSKLGNLGANEAEAFLPVTHREPFGVMHQRLRFEGSSDNSDLEGDEPRWIRFDLTFTLRTLVFRKVTPGADPVYTIIQSGYEITTQEDGTPVCYPGGDSPSTLSSNLFRYPTNGYMKTHWPVEGKAKVVWTDTAMKATLGAVNDFVPLVIAALDRRTDGVGVVSIAINYNASLPFRISVLGNDPVADTPFALQFSRLVPAGEGILHLFAIANAPQYQVRLEGVGTVPHAVTLRSIDVRNVKPLNSFDNLSIVPGDPVDLRWTGLARVPYLLIVSLTSTSGAQTITARDDVSAAEHTQQAMVDASHSLGVVFLMQPLSDSLALSLPPGVAIASATAVGYAAHYDGTLSTVESLWLP